MFLFGLLLQQRYDEDDGGTKGWLYREKGFCVSEQVFVMLLLLLRIKKLFTIWKK